MKWLPKIAEKGLKICYYSPKFSKGIVFKNCSITYSNDSVYLNTSFFAPEYCTINSPSSLKG